MSRMRIILLTLSILSLALAACSGDSSGASSNTSQQSDQSTEVIADQPTEEMEEEPTPTAETVDIEAQAATEEIMPTETDIPPTTPPTEAPPTAEPAAMNLPEWQMIEFTDARTGETFSFADYAGKTIFIEPMATWCPNCTSQLGNVAAARNQVGTENFVFIGLSLETYLDPGDLADHADRHGWNWQFAVISDDALRTFVSEFGSPFGNAPSTPHFIIRPDGTWTDLDTGMESTDELVQQLQAASGGA